MSDSLKMEATGDTRERLVQLLDLCANQSATGLVRNDNKLEVIHEYDSQSATPKLSFKPSLLADAIMAWIEKPSHKSGPKFEKEPDIDGYCKRGWRLVSGGWHDPIEIHPHWMIYHK